MLHQTLLVSFLWECGVRRVLRFLRPHKVQLKMKRHDRGTNMDEDRLFNSSSTSNMPPPPPLLLLVRHLPPAAKTKTKTKNKEEEARSA